MLEASCAAVVSAFSQRAAYTCSDVLLLLPVRIQHVMWTLAAECMLSLRYALTSVRWWEKAEELFGLTNLYPPRMIETERGHSGSPDRCATNHPVSCTNQNVRASDPQADETAAPGFSCQGPPLQRGWLYVNYSSGMPRRDYRARCVPRVIEGQYAQRGRCRLGATGAYGNIHNDLQPWLRPAAPGLSETS